MFLKTPIFAKNFGQDVLKTFEDFCILISTDGFPSDKFPSVHWSD
jgi:hypothetical protein